MLFSLPFVIFFDNFSLVNLTLWYLISLTRNVTTLSNFATIIKLSPWQEVINVIGERFFVTFFQ